ncbi:MAG: hypothetical protein U0Z26_19145 [Anaerolineales bacterium]
MLVRFSQLVTEQRYSGTGAKLPMVMLIALDARVLVYDKETTEDKA